MMLSIYSARELRPRAGERPRPNPYLTPTNLTPTNLRQATAAIQPALWVTPNESIFVLS